MSAVYTKQFNLNMGTVLTIKSQNILWLWQITVYMFVCVCLCCNKIIFMFFEVELNYYVTLTVSTIFGLAP